MLLLNAIGCACVGLMWLAGGGGTFEPYCAELAQSVLSKSALLKYCGWLALYAAGVELVLRGSQLAVERPFGWKIGALAAAGLYAAAHGRFGALNAAYAFALGSACALFFAKTRRLSSMVAWHLQWDFGALIVLLFSAVWNDGASRQQILLAYKAREAASGKLRFVPEWGWIDRVHEVRWELDHLKDAIRAKRGETARSSLKSAYRPTFGTVRRFRFEYEFAVPADASERGIHLMACAAAFDFAQRLEMAQDAEPFWTGASFSAFARDDLPATFFTGFGGASKREWVPRLPPAEARERWLREGPDVLKRLVRGADDFEPLAPELREPFREFVREVREAGQSVRYLGPDLKEFPSAWIGPLQKS